jgi:hypothetical protein
LRWFAGVQVPSADCARLTFAFDIFGLDTCEPDHHNAAWDEICAIKAPAGLHWVAMPSRAILVRCNPNLAVSDVVSECAVEPVS